MSPRLQRLATDWKTYAGVITGAGAGLAAATDLVKAVASAVGEAAQLPPEAKWLAAGLLAVLSVLALVSALSRRSALLRPERFVISADDPQHLVGREDEIERLAMTCEQNSLVFLQGESGAGKSALVLGGLLPHYQAPRAGNEAPRLLPIRVDVSPLAWDKGLRIELARALREVSVEEQVRLGASGPLGSGDPFAWLAALPVDAPCQVLLVLDQIDDYAVAHRARFVRDNTVVVPEQFEEANADWAATGGLVRKGSIRLLIVCRADAAGILDSLRFTRATTFLLLRVDQHLISPILDRITHADEGAPVVAHPEHGWLQLKNQLLRDLAAGGSPILPVQLAIGLDSLRRFRSLTPAEYAKNGGVRGLERLHIERHVHDAARTADLAPDALLRGLMCLVTELSKKELKTKRATMPEFVQATGVPERKYAALKTVVEHLVRWRILRSQSSAESEYILLHHDYLARGVDEAYRKANRWVSLLREQAREFEEARGWRQRWRAFLPPVAQGGLWWGRLRGGFRYGEHRRLAVWSTLRLLPPAAAVVGVFGAGWWVDQINQKQLAEQIFAGIGSDWHTSQVEVQEWRQLAGARWPARLHAVRFALSRPSIALKAELKADLLAHAVVGLDPTGDLSRELVREAILPVLKKCDASSCRASSSVARRLRVAAAEVDILTRTLVGRIEAEQSATGRADLRLTLNRLTGERDRELLQPDYDALVEQMNAQLALSSTKLLALKLAEQSGMLEPQRVQLFERISQGRFEARDVQMLVAALLALIKSEHESFTLTTLGEGMAGLAEKLETTDVGLLATALVERMKTEQNTEVLKNLAEGLAGLTAKLGEENARPVAAVLLARIKAEQDTSAFSILTQALAGLSEKLGSKDARPLAVAIVVQMESEAKTYALSQLGKVLAGLAGKLEVKDVQPSAALLAAAMNTRNDFDAIPALAEAWVSLERFAYANLNRQKRVQAYVDLLRLPLVVGYARKVLLDGLDQLTGEKFEGDLWRFVDWATESDRGKDLRLDLGGP